MKPPWGANLIPAHKVVSRFMWTNSEGLPGCFVVEMFPGAPAASLKPFPVSGFTFSC